MALIVLVAAWGVWAIVRLAGWEGLALLWRARSGLVLAVLAAVLVGLLLPVLMPRLEEWGIRYRVGRMLAEGRNRTLLAPTRLGLPPEGVTVTAPFAEGRVRWPAVERVMETPEYLYLYVSAVSAQIVPRRAFPGDEAARQFLQTAPAAWQAARAG